MNDDSKFRSIPKPDAFKIPFKLGEKALLEWLTSLNSYDAKNACSQIMALQQSMNKTEIQGKNRLDFLMLINEYLKQQINRLSSNYWDSGFPLSSDEIVYAQIISWNYLLMGRGFFIAAENISKKNDIALALAMGLHALGQAQLHIAASYAFPCDGFWNLTYQIFYIAEKKDLLNFPVESNDLKSVTVNTLFVRSLIFYLTDTNQFPPRDLRTIFNFLPRVCVGLPISLYPNGQEDLFMLDLKYDNPPLHVKKQVELGSELVRYFSPIMVAYTIATVIKQGNVWNGTLKSVNNTLFSRVVKTLELKQKRKYKRQKEDLSLSAVIGFENILGFLYKISQKNQPETVKKPQTMEIVKENSSWGDDELDLAISDDHYPSKPPVFLVREKIWAENKAAVNATPNADVALKEIDIHDTSTNGYSLSWTPPPSNGKIGDLIGIVSPDKKRLEIAVIRRIILSSDDVIRRVALNTGTEHSSNFKMGTEVLGFESEIVYLACREQKGKGVWAVFIPGIEVLRRPDTVIFALGQFSVGAGVQLHRNNTTKAALLLKELHSTTAVSCVELAYPKY